MVRSVVFVIPRAALLHPVLDSFGAARLLEAKFPPRAIEQPVNCEPLYLAASEA